MSENESDVQRERATDDRDNVVLTGEEIELPGDGSDAAAIIGETSDLSVYETNMNLLYDALTGIGFDVVRPGGTFYIFPKALEDDAVAFCMKAKEYDLILVPSDSFGVPGYFRMAYCIDTEKVERSIAALEKFVHEVYGR